MHHYPSRAAAAIAAAVLLACTSTPAQAATTATASASYAPSQTPTSGTWGAVATQSSSGFGTGPLALSFTNHGGVGNPSFTPQYFTVGNTGTLFITAANYSGSASVLANVQITLESCSGTWNETSGVCSGGNVTTIFTVSSGSSTIPATLGPAPASPGTGIRLRATASSSGKVAKSPASTLSLDVSVDRTQVRTATTTGS
ncbi:hypothetical protein [Arthrobacter sp. MA-N2]|uniref:hypothetical protein n=1 Tax=Arthrobacter sp. MA-N2 TaxID=1101188 RepID=UPI00048349DE|nr:hypothetical protein [Arthrobacter sp. MA-N2]